jgi:hypothetical protein
MSSRSLSGVARWIAVLAVVAAAGCIAEETPPPPPGVGPALSAPLGEERLEQLVAPVALYPDPLLLNILTAATYPAEVVEARRWLADPENAALRGDSLAAALAEKSWDPSVKALVPFAAILKMMDDHLDWTQSLGEAFLAQQAEVMDVVQKLRRRAESAGRLVSGPQQLVGEEEGAVTILPPPSQMIYVPSYNPWCVYGAWPYPAYPPYFFAPWSGICMPPDYLIAFDIGVFLPFGFWEWGRFDWRHHWIRIDHEHYQHFNPQHLPQGDVWQHDLFHRGGVPYHNPRNAEQFQPGADGHRAFRGFEPREGAAPTYRAPPVFEGYGARHEVESHASRGSSSLHGMSGGRGGHR